MNDDMIEGAGEDTGSFLNSKTFLNMLAAFGISIVVIDIAVLAVIYMALHNMF